MNSHSIEFLTNYCSFQEPSWVWIMTGIARNKDNPNLEDNGFMRRLVIAKTSDILDCYNEIHTLANVPGVFYRIYISLNARNANKAFFNFQKRMLEISLGLFEGHNDAQNLVTKIGSLWKTELAQTHNRATKRFLIDIDNDPDDAKLKEVFVFVSDVMKANIRAWRKTVTGNVIVIDACDTRSLTDKFDVDVQKDSMIFVEQFTGV